ncbi:beta-galactosidase [Kitasatospora sp. NPDC048298]|uniref:beta-galactosidase n=1 Tax=Kitasatospora sp. NPDC048298 TaxID=3364049 RepID=UPI003713576D
MGGDEQDGAGGEFRPARASAPVGRVRDGLVRRGVDCLLFTADGAHDTMQQGGAIPGHLATATFGSRAPERLAVLRRHQGEGPLTAMEFWIGWFDQWGLPHHVRDPKETAASLDELLAIGASVSLYVTPPPADAGGFSLTLAGVATDQPGP